MFVVDIRVTMARSYHLVYFDIRGRAECTRILFALAGTNYTEERLNPTEWSALKTSGRCPFGQLPLLELGDGKTICQSSVILRFIANELGFSPTNDYDRARADIIVDATKDIENQFGRFFWEKDPDRKAKMKSSLEDEEIPKQLEYLEKFLEQNNGGKGYFVGDKITYADIAAFCLFNGYLAGGALEVPKQLTNYPLLVDLYNRVMNEPKVLEYLKKRKPNPDWYPY